MSWVPHLGISLPRDWEFTALVALLGKEQLCFQESQLSNVWSSEMLSLHYPQQLGEKKKKSFFKNYSSS